MNKSEIRKKILLIRKKKYSKDLLVDQNVFLKLLSKIHIKSKTIGAYYPFNYELNIMNILKILEKKNFTISLPKVEKNNMMNFFKWSLKDPLKINRYGIPESTSKKRIFPKILLVPLVSFDNKLNRLGYGGGYYDRYISKFEKNNDIVKIGVGFSFQKVKRLPIDKFDKKLNFIITEKGLIK